jgi:hypothetical protein
MNENYTPNRQIIEKFLNVITQDWSNDLEQDGAFEIRCLSENRTPVTERFALHAIDDAVDLAVRMNGLGLNVYTTINPIDIQDEHSGKGAHDASILRAHFTFADADDQRGLDGLKELSALIKPDIVVRTGTLPSERYHTYWRLAEPCRDLSLWRQRQADIAKRFGTDPAVVNPSRLMRIAGTVAYPNAAKMARGYIPELTTLKVESN